MHVLSCQFGTTAPSKSASSPKAIYTLPPYACPPPKGFKPDTPGEIRQVLDLLDATGQWAKKDLENGVVYRLVTGKKPANQPTQNPVVAILKVPRGKMPSKKEILAFVQTCLKEGAEDLKGSLQNLRNPALTVAIWGLRAGVASQAIAIVKPSWDIFGCVKDLKYYLSQHPFSPETCFLVVLYGLAIPSLVVDDFLLQDIRAKDSTRGDKIFNVLDNFRRHPLKETKRWLTKAVDIIRHAAADQPGPTETAPPSDLVTGKPSGPTNAPGSGH